MEQKKKRNTLPTFSFTHTHNSGGVLPQRCELDGTFSPLLHLPHTQTKLSKQLHPHMVTVTLTYPRPLSHTLNVWILDILK